MPSPTSIDSEVVDGLPDSLRAHLEGGVAVLTLARRPSATH